MKRTVKILLGLAGLVVVLVVLAAVVLPLVIDPNDYRDEIAARVETATGRTMQIDGELKLSVIPWLGVAIGDVRLGNPPGFGDAPFVAVESMAVGARLLPLLSRRLEISKLRLEGLELNLIRTEDGRANWEGLGGSTAGPAEPPAEDSDDRGAFRLAGIGGLSVTDARVSFEDRAGGMAMQATVPRFSVGALEPGKPFPVEGEASVSLGEPELTLETGFEASVLPSAAFDSVTVSGLEFRVDGEGGEALQRFEAEARASSLQIDLASLAGRAETITLSGSAESADGTQKASVTAPSVRFDLSRPSAALSDVGLSATLATAGAAAAHELTVRAPSVVVDMAEQVLSVPELEAVADGVSLSGNLDGSRISEAPRFTGALRVAEFSPRAVMDRLGVVPPPTADDGVLRTASMNARFDASPDRISVEGLDMRLDQTRLTGQAWVAPGEPVRMEGSLGIDAIDLDRYLPPPSEEEDGGDAGEGEAGELAFDWLKGLALDASLGIGQLKVRGLTLSDISARARARDGVLTIEPVSAALYGGTVRGSARLDARESPAVFRLDQSLASLGLGPFISDLAGFDRLAGTARLEADLETRARTTAGLLEGLNGTVNFDVSDAVYQGMNVWYEIQRAWAAIKGRPAPEKLSPDTAFREIRGTAVIRDGVFVNDDLVAGLEALGLAGEGKVDLAKSELDYRLEATVFKQVKDATTGEVSELAGERLPLKITGALADPKVQVDLERVLKRQAEKKVLEKIGVEGEEDQSAEEALKEKAREKLKKLFGGDG